MSTYPMTWLYKASYNPPLKSPDKKEIKLWGSGLSESLPITNYNDVLPLMSSIIETIDNEWRQGID